MPTDNHSTSNENEKPAATRLQTTTYSPVDFDVTRCLPPPLRRYEERARWLIGLIYWQNLMRFDRLGQRRINQGVPLKAAYLRKVLGLNVYKKIIQALEDTMAIDCDHKAIEGVKCFSYKLGMMFRNSKWEIYRFRKAATVRAVSAARKEQVLPPVHDWLRANVARIRVDRAAWAAAAETDHPNDATALLDAIDTGTLWYTVDPYGRAHTNLTNLNTELRKFLTVDGNSLISLDIACSQPIILGMKMIGVDVHIRPRYVLSRSTSSDLHDIHDIHDLHDTHDTHDIHDLHDTHDIHHSCASSDSRISRANAVSPVRRRVQQQQQQQRHKHPHTLNHVTSSDIQNAGKQQFFEDAQQGVLYENFMQYTGSTRDETKLALLRTLYYDPKRWKSIRRLEAAFPDVAKIIKALPDLYPGVLEYINDAKQHDHRKLSHDMQRDESYVIFNMICNTIHMQRPEMYIGTIHDAIVCEPEDADYVRKIMNDQFGVLKVHPRIKEKQL